MNDILTWTLDAVRSVDPGFRILLAGIGMFFETSILLGLIVPGDTIVLVTATGVTGWLEYVGLLFAVVAGALAGESVGFALGRWFGPRIRASRIGRWVGEAHWKRAETYLDRRGGIAVFVSRFLPVLHSLIPVTVGMSTMSYRRFLLWTAPACIVWAAAYVSVGWAAAGSFRDLSGQLHSAGYIFAAIIFVFFVLVLLAKKLIGRSEARHMSHPDTRSSDTSSADRLT